VFFTRVWYDKLSCWGFCKIHSLLFAFVLMLQLIQFIVGKWGGVFGLLNKWFCHFFNHFLVQKLFWELNPMENYTHTHTHTHTQQKEGSATKGPFICFLYYYYYYYYYYFIFYSFFPSLSHSILVLVFMKHNNKGGNIMTCHCHHLSSKFSMSFIGNNNKR